jgi:hypothetical protein
MRSVPACSGGEASVDRKQTTKALVLAVEQSGEVPLSLYRHWEVCWIWMKIAVMRPHRGLQHWTEAALNPAVAKPGPRPARTISYVAKREPRFAPAGFQGNLTRASGEGRDLVPSVPFVQAP